MDIGCHLLERGTDQEYLEVSAYEKANVMNKTIQLTSRLSCPNFSIVRDLIKICFPRP
jgi:hypothetical protein